jgi:hypothetical protein
MSTTQEPEINFHEQVDDLIRCFKFLNIFNNNIESESEYLSLEQDNDNNSLFRRNVKLDRQVRVAPDTKATPLIKGKVHLVPAILHLQFESNHATAFKCAPAAVPMDSDVVQSLLEPRGQNTSSESFLTWCGVQNRGETTVDLQNLKLAYVNLNLKWKVYNVVDPESMEDTMYAHFPVNDSWVALQFSDLSDESKAVQILNEREGYIIDCRDLRYHYQHTSPTFIGGDSRVFTLDTPLERGALFDPDEVSAAMDELVDNFKEDQDDPYIDADSLEGSELNFLCGSEDNLERLINLICHAAIPMDAWEEAESVDIEIYSATDDGDPARVAYDNMDYNSWGVVKEKLSEDKLSLIDDAFDAALADNTPSGHTWEYNDGPYDRQSGYDRTPQCLTFTVTAPSAHEQICAKIEIKKLAHIFGKAKINSLLK